MKGPALREFRKRQGMTQEALAELLSGALERNITGEQVGRWERMSRRAPRDVDLFLDKLALGGDADEPAGDPDPAVPGDRTAAGDSAPDGRGLDGSAAPAGPQAPLPGGTGDAYTRICADLTETLGVVIATGSAMVGYEPGVVDGQIIAADKDAWGAAFGELAEKNDTFRRLLVTASQDASWVKVMLVVGSTTGRCMENHRRFAARDAAAAKRNGDGPDLSEAPDYATAAAGQAAATA